MHKPLLITIDGGNGLCKALKEVESHWHKEISDLNFRVTTNLVTRLVMW